MAKCYKCEKCGEDIAVSFLSGFAHIQCKKCQSAYHLDQCSMKIYMFVPLFAVACSVGLSISFMKEATIDVKTIFILGISFTLVYIISMILIHANILKYEKKS